MAAQRLPRRARELPSADEEKALAQRLKERIYAAITGLAIVLVYLSGDDHDSAEHAAFSLIVGVLGITAAGLLADVLAHVAVTRHLPTGPEMRHLLAVAGGALGTMVVPLLLLIAAAVGPLSEHVALVTATIAYVLTLGVVGYSAIWRVRLAWWLQLIVLAALLVFGGIVVALQVISHA